MHPPGSGSRDKLIKGSPAMLTAHSQQVLLIIMFITKAVSQTEKILSSPYTLNKKVYLK